MLDGRQMRVIYSIGVRFAGHGIGAIAYHAVSAIHGRGHLKRLIVSLRNPSPIPDSMIRTIPLKAVCGRLLRQLGASPDLVSAVADTLYERLSANHVDECDIFHSWNGYAGAAIDRARKQGAIIVVDRASSHPRTGERILAEEYARWGLRQRSTRAAAYNRRRACAELEAADFIMVPSPFAFESHVQEGVNPQRLVLNPFGCDLNRFQKSQDADDAGVFRILFVGGVMLRKGVLDLLEAWSRLGLRDGELVLAGGVDPELQNLIRRYRADLSVRLLGFVSDPVPLFRRSSVFVFPSLEEGSALVTYEAMAASLPVVVTPNAGSIAVNGEDGFVIPVRSPELIAAALRRLYDDTVLRKRMGTSARHRVERYTWPGYGERLVATYEGWLAAH